ncbi:MAG: AAA family ATPase [Planctomycetaceae bacterium]|jgi:SpoVK/Ycf46/Vps4 family AAA+-type ATPase|nr:AAA family ATPase [Planctomycetaceae bacterium]
MTLPGKRIEQEESLFAMKSTKTDHSITSMNDENRNEKKKVPEKEKPVSFIARKPLYSFEQVILPESVRLQFRVLRSRITNHKLLYDDWELGKIDPQGRHVAFNLYGVPGTGKTMCVEALASELGKMVIDISYAEIESKYVGDTGKNITAAFKAASESGALLFFDEADSILGRRMTNVTQAADHGVNVARAVMLKQLDSFDGIVAFATNLSKNFDNAFVRRIAQHIEIPLPDAEGRRILWEKMISSKVPGREYLDWNRLVQESEGFSGGDIKNAVVNGLANTASLEEKHRTATTEIFVIEIGNIHHAKQNVGTTTAVKVKEEILDKMPENI